jgi:hypothetical protein
MIHPNLFLLPSLHIKIKTSQVSLWFPCITSATNCIQMIFKFPQFSCKTSTPMSTPIQHSFNKSLKFIETFTATLLRQILLTATAHLFNQFLWSVSLRHGVFEVSNCIECGDKIMRIIALLLTHEKMCSFRMTLRIMGRGNWMIIKLKLGGWKF